jgi:phage baseplate assembly protein V
MIGQVFARLQLMFAHSVARLIGHDQVQVEALDDEPLENINRVEPYGFSYRPKPGAQAYLLFPGGDRSYGVAIVIGDKQYQMTLVEGEVAIHDDEGNWVHLKRGGTIHVKAATEVFAETPMFRTSLDAEIGGNLLVRGGTTSIQGYSGEGGSAAWLRDGALVDVGVEVNGTMVNNGKDVSDAHRHISNNAGSPTSGVV